MILHEEREIVEIMCLLMLYVQLKISSLVVLKIDQRVSVVDIRTYHQRSYQENHCTRYGLQGKLIKVTKLISDARLSLCQNL